MFKRLARTKTLPYYDTFIKYRRTSFYNLETSANVMKLFTAVSYKFFVPGKLLQPSLMFAVTAGAYPSVGIPESCFAHVGSSLAHKH